MEPQAVLFIVDERAHCEWQWDNEYKDGRIKQNKNKTKQKQNNWVESGKGMDEREASRWMGNGESDNEESVVGVGERGRGR